jgi:hypothetical protein
MSYLAAFVVLLILGAASLYLMRRTHARPVPSKRAHPGDRCACGGTVRETSGKHGPFLGCTNYRRDRTGCNRAWQTDGSRLPGQGPR